MEFCHFQIPISQKTALFVPSSGRCIQLCSKLEKAEIFFLSVHNDSASKYLNNNATPYTHLEKNLMELSLLYFKNVSTLFIEKINLPFS